MVRFQAVGEKKSKKMKIRIDPSLEQVNYLGLSLLANLALFWSLPTSYLFTLQVLNLCVESSFHLKHFSQVQK